MDALNMKNLETLYSKHLNLFSILFSITFKKFPNAYVKMCVVFPYNKDVVILQLFIRYKPYSNEYVILLLSYFIDVIKDNTENLLHVTK